MSLNWTNSWLPMPQNEFDAINASIDVAPYSALPVLIFILLIISVLGFVSSVIIIVITFRSPGIRSTNAGLLMAHLSLTDCGRSMFGILYPLTYFVTGSTFLSAESCFLGASFMFIFCGMSLSALAVLALERYLTLVRHRELPRIQVVWLLACSWAASIVVTLLPVITKRFSYYAPKSSAMYCGMRYDDWSVAGVCISVFSIIYLLVPSVLIFLCYKKVILTFLAARSPNGTHPDVTLRQVFRMIQNLGQSTETSKQRKVPNKPVSISFAGANSVTNHAVSKESVNTEVTSPMQARDRLEMMVFRKSIIHTLAFNTCWGFYFISMIYELLSGHLAPIWMDSVAVYGGTFIIFITGIINLKFDDRYRVGFYLLMANS